MQKNETGPLTLNAKINSKWMKDLNVRHENTKIPEENTGSILSDISHSNFFLDMSLEARGIKAKISYWDFIKIKSFCTVNETIKKTKRQPTEWEKIFANDISDKGLIPKIYKEPIQLNNNNNNHNLIKQWVENLNRYFSKKTYRWPIDT